MAVFEYKYDDIEDGGGHAGCEAALGTEGFGLQLSLYLDNTALCRVILL